MANKVWIIQRDRILIGVYSSLPSENFIKTLLADHHDYIPDSGVKRLLSKGCATDGWVEWFITETEVEDCQ